MKDILGVKGETFSLTFRKKSKKYKNEINFQECREKLSPFTPKEFFHLTYFFHTFFVVYLALSYKKML